MRTKLLASLTAGLLVAACGESAWGQFSTSGSGSQGMFGSRTLGGSIGPGNRTFGGTSGLGGSSSGGGLGGSSFGGGRGSMGGSGLGSDSGVLTGSERFIRGNRQPGQFVGSDTQDLANALRGLSGARGTQGAGQASRSGLSPQGSGRGTRANQPGQSGRGQARGRGGRGRVEDVRTTVSTGFRYSRPAGGIVSSALATRLEKSTRIGKLSPIRVVFAAETVTLQGVVETEHDRALAAQLARLEPGVRRVKNELVVGPASDSGAAPSAAPAIPEAPNPAGSTETTGPLNPGEPSSPQ